jgi:hypothetical protein
VPAHPCFRAGAGVLVHGHDLPEPGFGMPVRGDEDLLPGLGRAAAGTAAGQPHHDRRRRAGVGGVLLAVGGGDEVAAAGSGVRPGVRVGEPHRHGHIAGLDLQRGQVGVVEVRQQLPGLDDDLVAAAEVAHPGGEGAPAQHVEEHGFRLDPLAGVVAVAVAVHDRELHVLAAFAGGAGGRGGGEAAFDDNGEQHGGLQVSTTVRGVAQPGPAQRVGRPRVGG